VSTRNNLCKFLKLLEKLLPIKYIIIKVKERQSQEDDEVARLSDIIEEFIKEMIKENEGEELQIQRNELANHFSCAPSQINYVLTTRFTSDKGYYIESKRGGGGFILIKRVDYEELSSLKEVIDKRIGESITYDGTLQILLGLLESDYITDREADMIKRITNDRTLQSDNNNRLRANILKAMLMSVLR